MNKIIPFVALVLAIIAVGVASIGGSETVREVVNNNVGSVSSPDISSPYFSYSDIRHWGAKDMELTDASTTVCALLSPVATSTLSFGSIKFTTGATTTQTISIGKGATPYVITKTFATSSATANEKITVLSATTTPVSDSASGRAVITDRIFSPSTYFIVQLSSANAYTDVEGICEATWIEN